MEAMSNQKTIIYLRTQIKLLDRQKQEATALLRQLEGGAIPSSPHKGGRGKMKIDPEIAARAASRYMLKRSKAS